MSEFKDFRAEFHTRWANLIEGETRLYQVKTAHNQLFEAFLEALEPGESRDSHKCNHCKSFLNHYGNVVAIKDGVVHTMWEFISKEDEYKNVPAALDKLIKSLPITDQWVYDPALVSKSNKMLGTEHNNHRTEDGKVITWNHFCVPAPAFARNKTDRSSDYVRGDARTTKDVFIRSLTEINLDAVDTVLELIVAPTPLYRGLEHKKNLTEFRALKAQFDNLTSDEERQLFGWANATRSPAVSRIRNTSIGTLLTDLSSGVEVDRAVRAFEAMVAPANYRRTTAVVSVSMIKKAQQTIEQLGYASSLHRKHAAPEDIPLSEMKYVHRASALTNVFDKMVSEVRVNKAQLDKAKKVSLDDFISNILTTATAVDLLVGNDSKFVSLIAPIDPESPGMFTWDNKISWVYDNNMTDSIREKVKNAGGGVGGFLRTSLEWFNYDDLDLSMVEPGGNTISFRSKRSYVTGGFLDIDMNAGVGNSRSAVENIQYSTNTNMVPGTYELRVNNYNKREHIDCGFNIEIETQGETQAYSHPGDLRYGDHKTVLKFDVTKDKCVVNIRSDLTKQAKRQMNGVETNSFQRVNVISWSPNYWGNNAVGNKHLIFFVEGAKIDKPVRPFFNEYLKSELGREHSKVFEMVGGQLQVEPNDIQMTGVGYSVTQKHDVYVRVNNMIYKVEF